MTDQSHDRFTLPGDIPVLRDGDEPSTSSVSSPPQDERTGKNPAGPEEAPSGAVSKGASHPAGRGWVPLSRDLGIPSEHESTRAPGTILYNGVEHSFPYGVPEDVVAACGHSEVFTTERRARFLDHLAFKGNVRAAAALVGVSHETAYRKRRQDAKFAALWDAAMVHARHYAESQLAVRAFDGVEVPIVHRGEIVAYKTVHDPRWMNSHLARLDKKVDEDPAAVQCAGRFDELLAEYVGHEAPAGFAEAAEEALDWRERDTAPDLPPTREEYVAWRRSAAMGGKSGKAEAARMHAAGEAAGAEWDAWHDGALAKVGAIVEGEAEDAREGDEPADLPYEIKSVPPRAGEVGVGGTNDLPGAGHPPEPGARARPWAQHGGGGSPPGATPAAGPLHHAAARRGPPPRAGEDRPPRTPRNSAARDRVTSVNPPARRPALSAARSPL